MEVFESGQDLLDDKEGLIEEKRFVVVKQSLLSRQIHTPFAYSENVGHRG
jgi:hypothetical protein